MMLAILFSFKSMELLENGLQFHSGTTPLFSMIDVSLPSLQSCCRIDADAWCKETLTLFNVYYLHQASASALTLASMNGICPIPKMNTPLLYSLPIPLLTLTLSVDGPLFFRIGNNRKYVHLCYLVYEQ